MDLGQPLTERAMPADASGPKPVVVGVDDGAAASAAVDWACRHASALGVPVRLVHAFAWSQLRVPTGPSGTAPGLRAVATRTLAEAESRAQAFGGHVEAAMTDGFPTPVLLDESRKAEIVVIGGRAMGQVVGLLVGSTGSDLSALAACPVVVLRPGGVPEEGAAPTQPRVVAGYDGSSASERAVEFALTTAQARGWRLDVVYVRRTGMISSDEERRHRGLDELVIGWKERFPGVELTHEVLEAHNPTKALIDASEGAQLVVVGSRGAGGFVGLLLGSVSHAVLAHARCPVAVVPTDLSGCSSAMT